MQNAEWEPRSPRVFNSAFRNLKSALVAAKGRYTGVSTPAAALLVQSAGMLEELDAKRLRHIRRRLLAWFDRNRRDLPWRRTRDPYAVWLSEMMLQQTQVATVIPYYERFMVRFPTVGALAAADEEDVLHLWAGLGYYARARSLHRAARRVVTELDGRFPDSADALRRLPGVGRYSAGAVASIAFGRRESVVDGNVARVLARLFNMAVDVRAGSGREAVWELADRLVPRKRCGDFNQALMELGARVCLPGEAAKCSTCPLRPTCAACSAGTVSRLPVRTRPPVVKSEVHVVAAIECEGRWLFVRREARGLWGGLWEMPTTVLDGQTTVKAASDLARRWTGTTCNIRRRPFCEVRHQLTHRSIRFVGHVCRPREEGKGRPLVKAAHGQTRPPAPSPASKWLSLSKSESLGMSRAMRKVIAALADVLGPTPPIRRKAVATRKGKSRGLQSARPFEPG